MKKGKFVPGDFRLVARRSSAGIGLFTESEIPKGACIIEYVGRHIPDAETYTSRSKYLFEINSKVTIDGPPRINKAGYINHSCRPNAEPEIRKGHIYIMARRRILPGEELTYNYGKEYFDEHIRPKGCRCVKHQATRTK
jgi:SET domain-containing protein